MKAHDEKKIGNFVKKLKGIEANVVYSQANDPSLKEISGKIIKIIPNRWVILDIGSNVPRYIPFISRKRGIHSIEIFGVRIYENPEAAFFRFYSEIETDGQKRMVSKGKYLL